MTNPDAVLSANKPEEAIQIIELVCTNWPVPPNTPAGNVKALFIAIETIKGALHARQEQETVPQPA